MPDIQAALEDWASAVPADEWRSLRDRVRPFDEPSTPPLEGSDD